MKAAAIKRHGGLGVVEILDLPRPRPAAGQLLVEVQAAALNHLDIWVRKGGRFRPTMPHVLGSDSAGVVAELGPGVKGFVLGDEVIIYPGLNCGRCEACVRGEHRPCESFGIIGAHRSGVFAQAVAVPAANVAAKPKSLDFHEAAALPVAYLTAWRMLMTRAKLLPGQTVLIHGIGGGVALAGMQLAKLAEAKTIVTSSSDRKLSQATALGADHAVNYRRDDVAQAVGRITAGRGVDIALDTVGAATWALDFQAVRCGGSVVICGVTSGDEAMTDLQTLYWKQLTLLGSTLGSREEFDHLLQAVGATGLKPVIDSVVPLSDIRAAQGRMEAGKQFGKIVLSPMT